LDRLNVRPIGGDGSDMAQLAWGRLVSGNYFSVLGVKAAKGRLFTLHDDQPGAAPVAVVSYKYWKGRFNLEPAVVGQAYEINGIVFTLVGVTPSEFFGESVESDPADFWLPATLQPELMKDRGSLLENPHVNWLNLMGRLKSGTRIEQAQAAASANLYQFLNHRAGPDISPSRREEIEHSYITLVPGSRGVSDLRFMYSQPLHLLMAVVAVVLLIACANVANVLLARSAARDKEISTRLALGASRTRLVRQLLTESTLLACLGGAAGMLIAGWGVNTLVAMVSPGGRTIPLNITPDFRVLGFTIGVSLVTGILFGLAPALKATHVDLVSALKGGILGSRGRPRWGLSKTLVVSQVAFSLPLLVGAGLFLRSLERLHSQDLGFNRKHVLEVGIDPRLAGYKPKQLDNLYEALLNRVNTLPGVRVASLSLYSPISGDNWSGQISVEGYVPPSGQTGADCQWVWVGPRYAETIGVSLLLGRDLKSQDTQSAPRVALVNESFVRSYLAGQYPIGRRFSMNVPAKDYEFEIVGVMKDFKFNELRQDYWPVAFMPLVQSSMEPARYAAYLEIRTSGEPTSTASMVRQAIREVDRSLPITGIKTLSQQVDDSLTQERMVASLSSFFGLLALLLACIGLYGVLAYAVTRRSKEIGIRVALGATHGNILGMVLHEALLLVLLGSGLGLVVAFGLSRWIENQLYGLKAIDPLTLIIATLLLAAAATFAGYIPARRASRLDPMVTLGYE
jgi:predicted permease